ncbi:MAG: hypothetical protein JWQ49_1935 [Edaphobacter sp.]|nr:hypothetical protein [Edaphobacter sp.]
MAKEFAPILPIGGAVDKSLRLNPGKDIEYFGYADLLARARSEVDWLMKSLSEPLSTLKLPSGKFCGTTVLPVRYEIMRGRALSCAAPHPKSRSWSPTT